MITLSKVSMLSLVVAAFALLTVVNAHAKDHPAYLHALTDLRAARAHLDRMGPNDRVEDAQGRAIAQIDAAIKEIKQAAIDDGKNLDDHPPVDANLKRTDRFRRALELLDKAHHDVKEDEDNHFARGLQHRALQHIDAAHRIVEHIIH